MPATAWRMLYSHILACLNVYCRTQLRGLPSQLSRRTVTLLHGLAWPGRHQEAGHARSLCCCTAMQASSCWWRRRRTHPGHNISRPQHILATTYPGHNTSAGVHQHAGWPRNNKQCIRGQPGGRRTLPPAPASVPCCSTVAAGLLAGCRQQHLQQASKPALVPAAAVAAAGKGL